MPWNARGSLEILKDHQEMLVRLTTEIVYWLYSNTDMGGRKGGVLSVFDKKTEELIFQSVICEVSEEKLPQYKRFSEEKGIRLLQHEDHFSSWQSRDPDRKRYAGAVGTLLYVLSFSGLPEMTDEALVLLLAVLMAYRRDGYLTECQASHIAELSGNVVYPLLLSEFTK